MKDFLIADYEGFRRGTEFEIMPDSYHDWEMLRFRVRKNGSLYLIPMRYFGGCYETSAEKR